MKELTTNVEALLPRSGLKHLDYGTSRELRSRRFLPAWGHNHAP